MRLTLHTDYALRALIFLACTPDRLVSIREIARTYGISENHLVKIIHKMGRAGFIETSRGRNGGLRLARAPEKICIGAVVRLTEGEPGVIACMKHGMDGCSDEESVCLLMPECQMRLVFVRAFAAFFDVFDAISLADVVTNRERYALGFFAPDEQKNRVLPDQAADA
ncbi:RrF2 family transcriptional regulator [Acetobacter conturbans]|uniref:Rrf2 family transcriptional regulator n=1 Tax=Acetobacter conturbans TaxID=1737472 RepID=A0ABX0K2L5_9PROT|nr:Rrf2 family transcriptional regulator [Acetobacter conturbans]NHN89061.1 Rrf2 family transcriptional regulator [Acetobacter conturbans]